MTAPFKVPKGDPGALRREAARLGRAAEDLLRASKQVEAHAVTALNGWTGIHAAMFAVSAGGTFTALEVEGNALKAVSQGVKRYAAALEKAQKEMRDWIIRGYEDDERELAKPGLSAERQSYLRGRLFTFWPQMAEGNKGDLLRDGDKATAPLYALAQLKLEKKADPDPKGLLDRFRHSAQYKGYAAFKGATDPVLAFLGLLDGGTKAATVFQYLKQGVLGKMAKRKLSRAELEKALITQLWREGGTPRGELGARARELAGKIAAANQRVETAERIMAEARPQLAADLGEGLAAGRYAKVAKGLAKGSAVLGIIAGVDDILNNQDTGWVRTGNYVAGGSGIAGGLLVLFGGVIGSFTGATEAVVITGLALGTISAGWTFGKWGVEKGKENKQARGVGNWLKKHTTDKAADGWRKLTWSLTHPAR
ncbi:hypothetical protein ABZ815_38120 [Nonomuraea sp. NPDC047529]|uniref:hypothetical protein n=1 Tax=Nonomuraea sp. NPDC047529 TaxID=3155623 RepID=UPI0033DB391A